MLNRGLPLSSRAAPLLSRAEPPSNRATPLLSRAAGSLSRATGLPIRAAPSLTLAAPALTRGAPMLPRLVLGPPPEGVLCGPAPPRIEVRCARAGKAMAITTATARSNMRFSLTVRLLVRPPAAPRFEAGCYPVRHAAKAQVKRLLPGGLMAHLLISYQFCRAKASAKRE